MKNGFSFIELLFVMFIISIISLIAYPNFNNYIIRAHRSDGQTALLDLSIRMENYYAENNSYKKATIGEGNGHDILASNISPEGFYILSITNATDSTYDLKATPIMSQATGDKLCQSLTISSLGNKNITTGPLNRPTGTSADCW